MNTVHTPTHTAPSDDARVLSDADAERIIDRVIGFCKKEDELRVQVQSRWLGGQRWARNRAFLTCNMRDVFVRISRAKGNIAAESVALNQVDDDSLRAACAYVEAGMTRKYEPGFVPGLDLELAHPTWASKGIPVWSEVTYNRTATENAQLVAEMTGRAESNGMMSSGQLDTAGAHYMGYARDSWGREVRETGHATMAECSTTVRHPKGVGSGWAGASSFDLPRIDLAKLGEVAFDKCLRSMNPVRIEPGRYQTILEPQAAASFAIALFELFWGRGATEDRRITHPMRLGYDAAIDRGRSKLGLQIVDRRLSISHDPEDPITGSHVAPGMDKTTFVTNGVLTEMMRKYDTYSLPEVNQKEVVPSRTTFDMRGSEITSTEEMISSMKRGLLLTRVSDMTELDRPSALYTGTTRDGLWLIENGKITNAVRNFRWTESPLFIFNNVESIGASVSVMNSWYEQFPFIGGMLQRVVPSVVVPILKINDFSFTSTIDAI